MRALALDLFGYAARTWGPKSQHLGRLLPFLIWLPRVNRKSLRDDLLAALTGAIVVLPQGVAFATIAGMPPTMARLVPPMPTSRVIHDSENPS